MYNYKSYIQPSRTRYSRTSCSGLLKIWIFISWEKKRFLVIECSPFASSLYDGKGGTNMFEKILFEIYIKFEKILSSKKYVQFEKIQIRNVN